MKYGKTGKMLYRKDKQGLFGRKTLAILVVIGLLVCAGVSSAADIPLPPVNLGETSFQDGIAFPGWLVEETFDYYHAGQFNNSQGEQISGSNKLTAVSATTHVAYISNFRLLGGFYGAEILLPLVDVDVDTSFGPKGSEQGVGDLIISPFILQWTDHKLFGMPYFHRFVFDITLPTGAYDRNRPVNIGSNTVSINPYYAFTIMPTDRLEMSARLHYLWNSENDEPFVGLGAGTIQPGQAFHANYAASYEVVKGVRLGINGYALQQLTEDKVDGRSQANSDERVFGIGPGIKWSGNGLSLYLNSYFETGAENRPEGTKVVFRLSKVF
ncbi:SphA family protein [Geotalea uraniireducens]|uniref:Protein involved in meta-pathway of phenol degradation-like protein n=1 Tax=Geotalea uraniireducens (strain Rf4) TaxID=351605 RepID=A5GAC7_GEOUR|nr:transporter [Geotalea uraniireducens]ABQ25476.1 Protein involved in meta-pathway of phenol degradation-like protein [Geotalea uraniireducens Rf4]